MTDIWDDATGLTLDAIAVVSAVAIDDFKTAWEIIEKSNPGKLSMCMAGLFWTFLSDSGKDEDGARESLQKFALDISNLREVPWTDSDGNILDI